MIKNNNHNTHHWKMKNTNNKKNGQLGNIVGKWTYK